MDTQTTIQQALDSWNQTTDDPDALSVSLRITLRDEYAYLTSSNGFPDTFTANEQKFPIDGGLV